jgi:hypothetical protein
MRRAFLLAGLALLPSCGDWPDLGVGDEVAGYPRLVPFEEVAAPGDVAPAAQEEEAEADAALIARADALRTRAAGTAPSPEDRGAFDALRARPPLAP